MEEKKGGIFYGWFIVIGCCFMQACMLGLMMNSAGIFYTPVTEDLGVGLGPLALYVTVYFLVTTFTYPLVGRLLPRYNVNVLLSICVIGVVIGMALMGTYHYVWQWYISGVVYGFFGAFIFVVSSTSLIENWFIEKRGLALGITQCMSGLGSAIWTYCGTLLINGMGWRFAYICLAIVAGVLVLPWTLFVFKFKPEDKGLHAYGSENQVMEEGEKAKRYAGVPAKKAILTLAFWCLLLYGGVEALMSGYNTHIPGFAVSVADQLNMTATQASVFGASLLSVSQIGYVFATIIIGWLTDKIGVTIPTFVTLAITALALLGFAFLRNQTLLLICAFFFGTNSVIITISVATMISDIFGKREYTQILSWARMSGVIACFGSSGIGFVYDATGRFDISFIFGVFILIICAILAAIALASKNKIHDKYWVEEGDSTDDDIQVPDQINAA